MDGLSEKTVARDGIGYNVPDCQIILSPTTIFAQVESERSIYVPRFLNHRN